MTDGGNQGRRRAIVLIPGLRREERFLRRDVLAHNLATVERWPLEPTAERIEVPGGAGLRLKARPVRRAERSDAPEIDLFEAYWADMVPDQAELGPWQKLGHGLDLLAYWLFSWRTWRAFFVSRYITAGLMFGGLILVLWYLALALVVADALTKDATLTQEVRDLPVLGALLGLFLAAADAVGNWYLWTLIVFLLSFVPVDALVQMARFTKDYLENRPDETGVGLRDRLRQRVAATLEDVFEAAYDEVVVVAHSFGTVIAVDLLADWPHQADFRRLALVTLGSPIAVLRHRSSWLEAERRQLLDNPELASWFDFYARTDWLCTAITGHRERYGEAMSRDLHFEAPLRETLTGQTHLYYYRDPDVLETLVAP